MQGKFSAVVEKGAQREVGLKALMGKVGGLGLCVGGGFDDQGGGGLPSEMGSWST